MCFVRVLCGVGELSMYADVIEMLGVKESKIPLSRVESQ